MVRTGSMKSGDSCRIEASKQSCQSFRNTLRQHKASLYPSLIIAALVACSPLTEEDGQSNSEAAIPPQSAAKYFGEVKTVCGNVSRAVYLPLNRGQPTYLTLGISYSKEVCSVVIWGRNRSRFSEPPETLYEDKRIRVKGQIRKFRGQPQIEVTGPDQIVVVSTSAAPDEAVPQNN